MRQQWNNEVKKPAPCFLSTLRWLKKTSHASLFVFLWHPYLPSPFITFHSYAFPLSHPSYSTGPTFLILVIRFYPFFYFLVYYKVHSSSLFSFLLLFLTLSNTHSYPSSFTQSTFPTHTIEYRSTPIVPTHSHSHHSSPPSPCLTQNPSTNRSLIQ